MLQRMRPPEQTRQPAERGAREPRAATARAAISLLTDGDPSVVAACRRQILLWGSRVRDLLLESVAGGSPELAKVAGAMLRSVELRDWRDRVTCFAAALPSEGRMDWSQLEAGAVLLSELERDQPVDAAELEEILDSFGDELRPRARGKSAVSCARLLAGFLSGQLGYGGSQSSYYDVSHVQIDKVLNVRRGVPVALALLYILVGRRAGMNVTGVAIPDHFLVRVHGVRPVLIDPYHEGRQVTKADCTRYLRLAGYSLHTSSYLEDVSDRQILDCLLRSLLRVYGYQEDHECCSILETTRQALMRA